MTMRMKKEDGEKKDGKDKDKEEEDEKDDDDEDKEQMIDGIPENFIGPLLADLVAHEVGHTIGLRHNFKASVRRIRWRKSIARHPR